MNKNDFKNLDALINETNKNSQVQIEAKDFLEENLLVIADLYLQAYQKKDYETLHKMLKEQRKLFKTIFDLVNNRRLQVEKHFDKRVNYCILNEEGRKIFIEAFEERLESVFMHPRLKRKVSYRTALKLDCYKLIKNILEEKEFIPFSLKEGM